MNKKHPDWTTQELANAAGIDQSRIRQLILYGEFKDKCYKRAERWFIPFEVGQEWLNRRFAKGNDTKAK